MCYAGSMESKESFALVCLILYVCTRTSAATVDLYITLNENGTALFNTTPAEVMLSQVVRVICTDPYLNVAVYNIYEDQYESCTLPNSSNIHIGDCTKPMGELILPIKTTVLSTSVQYKVGESFYFGVFSLNNLFEVNGSVPCQKGVKFILAVVEEFTTDGTAAVPGVIINPTESLSSTSANQIFSNLSSTALVEETQAIDGVLQSATQAIAVIVVGAAGGTVLLIIISVVILVILSHVSRKRERRNNPQSKIVGYEAQISEITFDGSSNLDKPPASHMDEQNSQNPFHYCKTIIANDDSEDTKVDEGDSEIQKCSSFAPFATIT